MWLLQIPLQMQQELERLRKQLDQSEGGRDTLLQQVSFPSSTELFCHSVADANMFFLKM